MNHLIIIDMQNDFVTGTLANPNAEKTIPTIVEAVKHATHEGWKITYTVDTHDKDYLSTDEGRRLPVIHCVDGTWGQEIIPELKPLPSDTVFKKRSFAYDGWRGWICPGDTVTICGTLSEVCVVANVAAIRAIPNVHIKVLRDGCSALSDEAQETAMTIMASLHCDIIQGGTAMRKLLLQCLPADTTQTRIRINDTQITLLYDPTNSPDPYTLSEVSGITAPIARHDDRSEYALDELLILNGYNLESEMGATVYETASSLLRLYICPLSVSHTVASVCIFYRVCGHS